MNRTLPVIDTASACHMLIFGLCLRKYQVGQYYVEHHDMNEEKACHELQVVNQHGSNNILTMILSTVLIPRKSSNKGKQPLHASDWSAVDTNSFRLPSRLNLPNDHHQLGGFGHCSVQLAFSVGEWPPMWPPYLHLLPVPFRRWGWWDVAWIFENSKELSTLSSKQRSPMFAHWLTLQLASAQALQSFEHLCQATQLVVICGWRMRKGPCGCWIHKHFIKALQRSNDSNDLECITRNWGHFCHAGSGTIFHISKFVGKQL